MMECDHDILKNIQEYYISQIVTKNSAMANLPSDSFFKYCILCIDMNIVERKFEPQWYFELNMMFIV